MKRFCITIVLSLIISGNTIAFGKTLLAAEKSSIFTDTKTLLEDFPKHEKFEKSTNVDPILSEQEDFALVSLANKLRLSYEELKLIFSFNAAGKHCSLVPICNCKEHLDCFVNIFSQSDPYYMRHYRDGTLMPVSHVEKWFFESVEKMNQDHPQGITLLIKVENQTIGRIGLGPFNDSENDLEIGYALQKAYSGQGIMSKAVAQTIHFLRYLRSADCIFYNFARIRATAKEENIASNKILLSCGFIKSEDINTSYGPRQEYFYYF